MRRFKFSLERLLEYRRAKAEATRRHFAAVLAEVERITFEIGHIEQRREELAERLLEMHLNAQTRRELTEGRSYLEHLWLRMMRLRDDLGAWRSRLEEARHNMAEAQRDLEALERLRDREMERHRKAELKEEQEASDEAGLSSYFRSKVRQKREREQERGEAGDA